MANEFIARKGLIALEDSQITGSLDISSNISANNLSGTNTGDQDLSGLALKTSVSGALGTNATLIRSLTAAGISGSFNTPSASFNTRVSDLEGNLVVTAGGISGSLGTNATLIRSLTAAGITGSFSTPSASFNTRLAALEDNLEVTAAGITGSFTDASSSFNTRVTTLEGNVGQAVNTNSNVTFATITSTGNIETTGDIIANRYIVSSSVTHLTQSFSSGSTVFGDTPDDTHQITGSLLVSGGLDVNRGDSTFRESVQVGKLDRPITLTGGTTLLSSRPTITGGGSSYVNFDTGLNLVDEKKISFDGDTTNTYIAANSESPEDLEIHADQDIILNPDGQVIANSNVSASGNLTVNQITSSGAVNLGGVLTIPGFTNVSASLASAVAGGDNLGNHTATEDIDLDGNAIKAVSSITASGDISASGDLSISGFSSVSASLIFPSTLSSAVISGSLGTNATLIRSLTAAGISGSLGTNATLIRSLTAAGISGSLGTNATLIRSLTAAGISGSFVDASASLAANVATNSASSASFNTRVSNLEGNLVVTAASISGSLGTNATLIRSLTAAGISGSFVDASSSLAGDIVTNQSSITDLIAATSSFSTATGVEDNADVTDTSNVTSAGALMDSELAEIATVKALTAAGISGSFVDASASLAANVATNSASSASFNTRVLDLEGNLVVTANGISGSLGTNATLIRSLTAAGITGSFAAASSSFNTRLADLEDNLEVTAASVSGSLGPNATLIRSLTAAGISGSFVDASASLAADVATNSASSASFNTRVSNLEGNLVVTAAGISGSLGTNATLIRSLTAAGISGSFNTPSASFNTRVSDLENNLVVTATGISGSLGTNATLIRSLTAAGISGSFVDASASLAADVATNTAASSSFNTRLADLEDNLEVTAASVSGSLGTNATLIRSLTAAGISGSFNTPSASFNTRLAALEDNLEVTAAGISGSLGTNATLIRSLTAAGISGSFVDASASLAADIATNAGNIGTTTNALTVDNATLQLNSGTTFNGSAARTISIKDGGVDSDALAADIAVTSITASAISASGEIKANSFTGNGLSIDGSQNSHIEVGTYNVGFDTAAADTVLITGSGLIVSGAMADANHHNMVKIGNVELIDLNTALSANEFLIHNVSSLKITSGSDGGDIANDDGRLFEHNGTDFTLYKNNSSVINAAANGTVTFNGTNISFVATGGTFMKASNANPSANGHIIFSVGDPNTTPSELNSINFDSAFPFLGGAITASAVSSSGKIITSELSALGDLTIDADGADILLKDGGTEFGRFKRDSSDFVIKSATNNKDIVFRGVDDSSTITALTLDMSDAGKAIFTSDVSSSGTIAMSTASIGGGTFTSASLASAIAGGDGGGTTTNALTVDNSTLQLNSGTTFDGSAARTISIKDGGVDSDALAADIAVTSISASSHISSSKLLIHKTGASSNETLISLIGSAGVEEFSVDEDGDLTCNDINVVNRDILGNGTTRLTLGAINLFNGDVRVNNTTATLSLRCSDSSIAAGQTMGKISLATNDGDTNDSADIKFIATEDHSNDPNSGTKIEFRADKNSNEGDETDTLMLTLNPNTGSIIESVHQNIYDTGSTALANNGGFGDIVKFGGSSTVAGGLYYLENDGTWALAQANAAATSTGSLAVAIGTNSTTDGMCLRGFINPFTDPGAGIGSPVYVSDTNPGRILATAPDSNNDVVRIVGHQYGTDLIYFNPSNDFIIVTA